MNWGKTISYKVWRSYYLKPLGSESIVLCSVITEVRMGDTCTPMADSWQHVAKTTTVFCKVISLQLKLNKQTEVNEMKGYRIECEILT